MKIPKTEAEIIYKVIEVDRALSMADWSKEDDEAIQTLKNQPGYLALLKKVRIRKALIDNALQAQRFETVADFSGVQAWSQCLKWVEGFIKEEVEKSQPKPRSAYAVEEEAFEKIAHALQYVGGKQN